MRVCVAQTAGAFRDKPAALDLLARAAGDASAAGGRLLVLPELFLTGYNIGPDAIRALAEPSDGPSAQAAAAIAARAGTALLYGYAELGPDGLIYNAAALMDAEGRAVAHCRKTQLFGGMERAVFTPGAGPCAVAEVDGVKTGVLICYDVEFPEMTRGLALLGADLVAVPTALMRPYEFVPRTMVPTRAYENQAFVIYANRSGAEGDMTYVGESCVVGPDGAELARAGAGEEMISAVLDFELLSRSRALNTYLADRLPERYAP